VSHGLSVIIPVYNAAAWLGPTVEHLSVALQEAGLSGNEAEIVLVNDGSTDNSLQVARALSSPYPIVILDQPNGGRFMARKAGLLASGKENVLFIDSRVFIHPQSLKYVAQQQVSDPSKEVWNSHVIVEKKGNIIARFGDAITFIGWRRYFAHPRDCSYGLKDFDHYPKGTTCFFVPKTVFMNAVEEFEKQSYDAKHANDDTRLIRTIARDHRIYLSPSFSCTYHARTKLSQFLSHSYHRGQVFVDGFLRPGNRFFIPLILFLIGSIAAVAAFALFPVVRIPVLAGLVALWLLELVVAVLLGVPKKDAFSLFALTPVFALAYGLGIWRAVFGGFMKPRHGQVTKG
jgi:glycosyltransferase involved in cell wall biosynthesis